MLLVLIINEMIRVETRTTTKKSEFQMGIDPTTFRTLVNDRRVHYKI